MTAPETQVAALVARANIRLEGSLLALMLQSKSVAVIS